MKPESLVLWAAAVFCALVVARIGYATCLRPFLIRSLRYELFALRDALRALGLKEMKKPDLLAYGEVQELLNVTIRSLDACDFTLIVANKPAPGEMTAAKHYFEVVDAAGLDIRRIHGRLIDVIRAAIAINSPGCWPLFLFALLGLAVMAFFNSARHRLTTLNQRVVATLEYHEPARSAV
jgi:hypothetical protein